MNDLLQLMKNTIEDVKNKEDVYEKLTLVYYNEAYLKKLQEMYGQGVNYMKSEKIGVIHGQNDRAKKVE